jgi:hypothetical protein
LKTTKHVLSLQERKPLRGEYLIFMTCCLFAEGFKSNGRGALSVTPTVTVKCPVLYYCRFTLADLTPPLRPDYYCRFLSPIQRGLEIHSNAVICSPCTIAEFAAASPFHCTIVESMWIRHGIPGHEVILLALFGFDIAMA